MRTMSLWIKGVILLPLILIISCSKETILVEGNDPPFANPTPAVRIESYINRMYIDLLGREPTDEELQRDFDALKSNERDLTVRLSLITRLQSAADFLVGDTSYAQAFHYNVYNQVKIRCLEGVSDEYISSRLGSGFIVDERLQKVLDASRELEAGTINIQELFGRLIFNVIYDDINMNSFNFVNASFDNLLWRFPSQNEFNAGFNMVDRNRSDLLFGQAGQNKEDYINILIASREMSEGIIIWVYEQLLARRPSTEETIALLDDFQNHQDVKQLYQQVMISDEYANFE